MSFVERSVILCPYLGRSTIRGFTVFDISPDMIVVSLNHHILCVYDNNIAFVCSSPRCTWHSRRGEVSQLSIWIHYHKHPSIKLNLPICLFAGRLPYLDNREWWLSDSMQGFLTHPALMSFLTNTPVIELHKVFLQVRASGGTCINATFLSQNGWDQLCSLVLPSMKAMDCYYTW